MIFLVHTKDRNKFSFQIYLFFFSFVESMHFFRPAIEFEDRSKSPSLYLNVIVRSRWHDRRCQGPAQLQSSVIVETIEAEKPEGGKCRVKGLYVSLRKKNVDPLGPGQARPCQANPR